MNNNNNESQGHVLKYIIKISENMISNILLMYY